MSDFKGGNSVRLYKTVLSLIEDDWKKMHLSLPVNDNEDDL